MISGDKTSNTTPLALRCSVAFFDFFREKILPMLEAERPKLERMYSGGMGRPAYDPVLLPGIGILQFARRQPDRQACESVQYDMRWRTALGLKEGQCSPAPPLLTVFRDRLLRAEDESVAFDAVLGLLRKEGFVSRNPAQRLDSTHSHGLVRNMSRLENVRETLRLCLEDWQDAGLLDAALGALSVRYLEERIDPRSGREALNAKMAEAGADALLLLNRAASRPTLAQRESPLLLQTVFGQNFDPQAQPFKAQPSGAVRNPHEPQAQWSSKDTTGDKTWVGYKTRLVETVPQATCAPGEPTGSFITTVITQPAIASDKASLKEVCSNQERSGMGKPALLHVDGACVYSESLLEAQQEGRVLMGPAPASPDNGKTFPADRFDVRVPERSATCPAGQPHGTCCRLESAGGPVSFRFEWSVKRCSRCPLKDPCLGKNQKHRTVTVGENHSLLQQRRKLMQTEAFKSDMRKRNAIEGTFSELVRTHGLRKARYRGLRKVSLQTRLFRRTHWLNQQPKAA
jgi:hypothetical protein